MTLTQITTGGVDENINIDSNTLKVDGTNNRVGIGTATAGRTLSVDGSIQVSNSTSGFGLGEGFEILHESSGSTYLLNRENAETRFYTNNTERLRINNLGNVGIGTTSPLRALTIAKTGSAISGTGNSFGFSINPLTNGYVYLDAVNSGSNNTSLSLRTYNNGTYTQALQSISGNETTFETAGTERMRIDSSGNVIIGTDTAAPNSLITVRATGPQLALYATPGNDSRLNMGDTDDHDIGMIAYANFDNSMRFTTNASERMRITSNGRLLLGSTSSIGGDAIFQVQTTGNRKAHFHQPDSGGSIIQFTNTTTGTGTSDGFEIALNGSEDGQIWLYESGNIKFGTANSERMRINSDGDIKHTGVTGAGGSNKRARYLVPSHSGTEEDVVVFQVENESGNNQITFGGGTSSYNAATTLVFRTAAAVDTTTGEYRGRFDSNGDFLLQTTSNTQYAITSGAGSWGYTADTGTARGSIVHANNADNGWSMMYMNKFNWSHPDDGRYINFYKNGVGGPSIQLNSSGNVDYNTSSDYRLKENIVPMTNGITRLKQLLPKQFTMIDDPENNLCDGFLAHEAQTVVPQAVCGTHNGMKTDEEGNEVPDYQGLDYGKLTPLLTAALQEAIAKIETLETKVAALEAAE